MPAYLSSGSAIERALICGSSVALPHAHHETEYTARGSAIHEFLEACSKVGRDDALAQVDEEFRDACAELNIDGLHAQLTLAAEVAFAYNFVTDTARELGRGEGRKYDDVGEDELPCTLDVVGVRELPNGTLRGLYVEWKSGFTTRRPIDVVTQIMFGALCVARAYGCDLVEGQLVHVHEDFAPWVQQRVIPGWEIDAFASELREHAVRWRELREQWKAGIVPRDFSTGPWCDRCPARGFCPAQTSLLRAVLSKDLFDGPLRMQPIPDEALADAWHQLHEAQSVLSLMKGKILGVAATRRIFLGYTEDKRERWLGTVIEDGNERLDGEAVFDVVAELHGEEVATSATKVTATKKDLDAAIKLAVPRGTKAKALKAIFGKLEDIPGAITTKTSTRVKEFVLKPLTPALDGGTFALEAADRMLAEREAEPEELRAPEISPEEP